MWIDIGQIKDPATNVRIIYDVKPRKTANEIKQTKVETCLAEWKA